MNTSPAQVIVSIEGFAHRSDLATHAEEKAAKLLRHLHPPIGCVRLHVRREAPHSRAPFFTVCARAETAGTDYVAHAEASEPVTAINAACDKLERAAAAAARARRHEQRHPCPVEVTVK